MDFTKQIQEIITNIEIENQISINNMEVIKLKLNNEYRIQIQSWLDKQDLPGSYILQANDLSYLSYLTIILSLSKFKLKKDILIKIEAGNNFKLEICVQDEPPILVGEDIISDLEKAILDYLQDYLKHNYILIRKFTQK